MAETSSEKILLVDDDAELRASLQRILHHGPTLILAANAGEGLEILRKRAPFAVIISHRQLPEMSGAAFLAQAAESDPEAVRIMLTSSTDLHTAIEAINEAHIFRFVAKPCADEQLAQALRLALRQHRLQTAEHELLGQTVHGVVELLTELLGMVNPLAFSEATRVKRYVRNLAAALELPQPWEYEMAAMLSQLGCATLPPEVLGKVFADVALDPAEQHSYADYPRITAQLLRHIPRLERVVRMIESMDAPFHLKVLPSRLNEDGLAALGGHLLKVCLAYDRLRLRGDDHAKALQTLQEQPREYDAAVLNAFPEPEPYAQERYRTALPVSQLTAGMVLMDDVRSRTGMLLVAHGEELTHTLLMRLRAFSENVGVREPVQVLIRVGATDAAS